jgi:hypothetical protein
MSEATSNATDEFRQAVSQEAGVPVEFLRGEPHPPTKPAHHRDRFTLAQKV